MLDAGPVRHPTSAAWVCAQGVSSVPQGGAAMPLVATGLLQHEAKLSVLNFAVKKLPAFDGPVANKDELLFVSGVRPRSIMSQKIEWPPCRVIF